MSDFHIIGCKIVPVFWKAVNVFIRRICLCLCLDVRVLIDRQLIRLSVKPLIGASWYDSLSTIVGCITVSFVWHNTWDATCHIRPKLIRCCDCHDWNCSVCVVNTARHTSGVCLISYVWIEGITTNGNCQRVCNRVTSVVIKLHAVC